MTQWHFKKCKCHENQQNLDIHVNLQELPTILEYCQLKNSIILPGCAVISSCSSANLSFFSSSTSDPFSVSFSLSVPCDISSVTCMYNKEVTFVSDSDPLNRYHWTSFKLSQPALIHTDVCEYKIREPIRELVKSFNSCWCMKGDTTIYHAAGKLKGLLDRDPLPLYNTFTLYWVAPSGGQECDPFPYLVPLDTKG